MGMSEFDRAVSTTAGGAPGTREALLDVGWTVGNGVNGGLLMALATSALRTSLLADGPHDDPLVLSAFFLSPSQPGPAVLHSELLRAGRTLTTGAVRLCQAGEDGAEVERIRALASFGDLDRQSAPLLRSAPAPDLPHPDECLSAADVPAFLPMAPIMERTDLRIDPATAGWATGKPSESGRMRGWIRLRDPREPDPLVCIWAVDAFPPVAFDLGLFGWVPTLELTVHLRAVPAPGWLKVSISNETVAGSLMEEDANVWDSTGRLVAQSRQLCSVRMPAGD